MGTAIVQQLMAGKELGAESSDRNTAHLPPGVHSPAPANLVGFLDAGTSLPGHGFSGTPPTETTGILPTPDAETKPPFRRHSPRRHADSGYPEQSTILVVRRGGSILHATGFTSQPESARLSPLRRLAPANFPAAVAAVSRGVTTQASNMSAFVFVDG